MFCTIVNVSSVQAALSPARLNSYQTLVGATAPDGAIGAYIWGLELNAALSPLLSMVEVVLRNSLHAAASAQFNKSDWYQDVLKRNGDLAWQNKLVLQPALAQNYYRKGAGPHNKKSIWIGGVKRNLKHWRSQPESKLEEIISRLTSSGKQQTPDQVVAHAMFGFWVSLFGPSFESPTEPLALWPNCTAQAFPFDPAMNRARAYDLLERIKNLRNRVFHQEPAWRIANPLTPAGVNSTISAAIQEMKEILNAMEPAITGLLENAGSFDRLKWLLDPQTLAAFADQSVTTKIDLKSLTHKVRKLATQAQRRIQSSGPKPTNIVTLQHAGKTILTIIPHG